MKRTLFFRGYTLLETMVAVGIISVILIPLTRLQINVFRYNTFFQNSIAMQEEARKNLQKLSSEIRSATVSNNGAYPIAEAGNDSLIFFRDADNDGLRERMRYFLDGNELKKGIVIPSGDPLTYDTNTERISVVAHDVENNDSPIFQYYDRLYDGINPVLTQPVDPTAIRLVKATLVLGKGTERQSQMILTTQVSLRNLKDNL